MAPVAESKRRKLLAALLHQLERAAWTHEQIAEVFGVSQRTLRRWKAGVTLPKTDAHWRTAYQLGQRFGVCP